MILDRPKDVTVIVPGPDRELVADAILDRAIELEAEGRNKRKGSPGALRFDKLGSDLRKIAGEIRG